MKYSNIYRRIGPEKYALDSPPVRFIHEYDEFILYRHKLVVKMKKGIYNPMNHIIDWLIFVSWRNIIMIWRTWSHLCCDCVNKQWRMKSGLELIILRAMQLFWYHLIIIYKCDVNRPKSILKRLTSVKDINFLPTQKWTKSLQDNLQVFWAVT